MKLKIYIEQRAWAQQTAVWIVGEDASGKRLRFKPMSLVVETGYEVGTPSEPTLVFQDQISADFLGALHDAIVESGYKPKDNGIEAVKNHLEDMRKLAFDQNKTILDSFNWK